MRQITLGNLQSSGYDQFESEEETRMTATNTPRFRSTHVGLALSMIVLGTIGCAFGAPQARVGDLVTKTESVALGDADSVQVDVDMAAGELAIAGGASELMEADFAYNVAELEPEVEYEGGNLAVRTPDVSTGFGSLSDLDDYRYEWDLRFDDDVPLEMSITMGAGTSHLELGSLSLTRLDIDTGASMAEVDLSDSATLTRLTVEAGVGQVSVDLTGNWQNDLDATLSNGVGELDVRLPQSVCARVAVDTGLGEVTTQGLTQDGDDYVNDACGASEVTLRIDISGGVGTINLAVAE
jgi:hypothetical protein